MGQGEQGNVVAPRVPWDLSAACRCDDLVLRYPSCWPPLKPCAKAQRPRIPDQRQSAWDELIATEQYRRHISESHFPTGQFGLLQLAAIRQDVVVEPRPIWWANWATGLRRPLDDCGRFSIPRTALRTKVRTSSQSQQMTHPAPLRSLRLSSVHPEGR